MTLTQFSMYVILPLMGAALLLAMVRLFRGPDLADRVVALEVIGAIVLCMLGVQAIVSDSASYLDVTLVIALMSFLGTVAVAAYMQRRAEP